jgi:hypothetical protein
MRKEAIMSENTVEKTGYEKTNPSWFKRMLLVLLFGSAAAGFVFSAPLFKNSTGTFSSSILQRFENGTVDFAEFSNLVEKADTIQQNLPGEPVICQGTLTSENGRSLAVLNGQIVPVGASVGGFRVLEISRLYVLVERKGETRRLKPGESFASAKTTNP